MVRVGRLFLYPIKALDPLSVSAVEVLPTGALKRDRSFALVDESGAFVNGKRHPAVHGIRAEYASDLSAVTLRAPGKPELSSVTAALNPSDMVPLEAWLSAYFGFGVRLTFNPQTGFPDDTDAPGPTVISTASLEEVAKWTGLSVESCRLRFRANVELEGCQAFWEDRLYGANPGAEATFNIGGVRVRGTNPCQRCIVPTRDAQTGARTEGFQKVFMEKRAATLPDWAARERFNHYYRLAVNTRIGVSESGKMISVNDCCSVT